MERKLKIILCVVIVILIAAISFLGIYTKDAVLYKNNLPEFILSSDFEGKRVTSFVPEEGTEEVIFDSEGKQVASIPNGANEEEYKKETRDINDKEKLNSDNYKKVKEILDGRLAGLGVNEYKVRLNEDTGDIAVELEENLNTDTILLFLKSKGDFKITDKDSGNILLDRTDLKNAKVLYGNASADGVTVYLDLVFNKEGAKKLQEISKEYIKVEDTNSENENEEKNENDNQKQVTLTLEGTEMLTTYFGEEITNGELTISLGKSADTSGLQKYVEQASFYAALLNNEEMPLNYEVGMSEVLSGNLDKTDIYIIIGLAIGISLIVIIYLICRYKTDGILAGISLIGAAAILLIALRYTFTEISINSIASIILTIILEGYLLDRVLASIKNDSSIDNVHKAVFKDYLKHKEIIIIALIIAIVFTFMQYVGIFSFGMTLFYGIISVAISNLVFLRTMLLSKYSKN